MSICLPLTWMRMRRPAFSVRIVVGSACRADPMDGSDSLVNRGPAEALAASPFRLWGASSSGAGAPRMTGCPCLHGISQPCAAQYQSPQRSAAATILSSDSVRAGRLAPAPGSGCVPAPRPRRRPRRRTTAWIAELKKKRNSKHPWSQARYLPAATRLTVDSCSPSLLGDGALGQRPQLARPRRSKNRSWRCDDLGGHLEDRAGALLQAPDQPVGAGAASPR